MKLITWVSIAILAGLTSARAEAPPFIQNMVGCFTVNYKFIEDGAHDYQVSGVEEVRLIESDGIFSLQRYGLDEKELNKHFREEWSRDSRNGKEIWTQKIFSPGGAFRYQCSAELSFNQFYCDAKGAPKPRRDIQRKDYSRLDRVYYIQSTPLGYVQAEKNVKLRDSGEAISNEVAWIEFTRVSADRCKPTLESDEKVASEIGDAGR
jgi:hypothetical protein